MGLSFHPKLTHQLLVSRIERERWESLWTNAAASQVGYADEEAVADHNQS